jgi:branched-chain amino acid transport system permease protein
MIRYWWLGVIFVVSLILPLFIGEFWIQVAIEILILGLFAVSFNMIFGYMGQLSFGHAAYFGAGAYATGLLMVKASVPLPICLAVSMVTAGLLALVIGYFPAGTMVCRESSPRTGSTVRRPITTSPFLLLSRA